MVLLIKTYKIMLSFFIGILLSLNIITESEVSTITNEDVIKKIETHAPQYMDSWELNEIE
jgi:hypothetical protein